MKKLIMAALVCLSVVGIVGVAAGSSLAANAPAPKATGSLGFTAYTDVQRSFQFDAMVTGASDAGRGTASYSDASGIWYTVNVQLVSVVGHDAWFAGPVTASNYFDIGQWAFYKVHDGGQPGIGVDAYSGSAVTQAQAINGVATHADPGDGPFTINSGNIQVH